jgi:hypothetical protein
MKTMFISGSILAITGLLLLLRSLFVRGTSERPEYHRVYLMSFDDDGDDRQGSDDEWPSLIGTEEAPASNGRELSEDERYNSSKLDQARPRSASSSRSY